MLDALLPFAPAGVCVMHSPVAAIAPALDEIRARWPGRSALIPRSATDAARAALGQPEELAAQARDWLACGAQIVGGCCGTTPEHIRALAGVASAAGYAGSEIGLTCFGTW